MKSPTVFFLCCLSLSSTTAIAEDANSAAVRLGLDCTDQGIYGKEHAKYHTEYRQMYNQLGEHCCHDGDCRPSLAVFDSTTERWLACVNEEPRFIGSHQHVKDAYGLTSFASVCVDEFSGALFCFIAPYNGG